MAPTEGGSGAPPAGAAARAGPTESPAAVPAGSWRASLRPLRLPLLLLALQACVLLAARLALLLLYPAEFSGLGAGEVARAFLRGEAFDAAAACTFTGLPLLLLALPLDWGRRRGLRAVLAWAAFGGFLLLTFAAAADLAYFGYVDRHVGPELRIAGEDSEALAKTAFSEYPKSLVLLAALWTGAYFLWRRLLRTEAAPEAPGSRRAVTVAVLFGAALVVGARGDFGNDPLQTEDAFEGLPSAGAQLALNGPFCASRVLLGGAPRVEDVLPREEALRITRDLLVAPGETVPDPDFPLYRSRPRAAGPRPNVVVVMLEGWSGSTVDALRAERGLPPLGITPRFSAFAGEGLLLTRMYASGQRTRVGLTALLAGIGSIPGVPTLGEGLEERPIPFLGALARSEGYATCYFLGFMAASQREAQIARETGFEDVVSGETVLGEAAGGAHAVPDHLLYEAASRRIATLREPFLAFIHTASTHVPYLRPKGAATPFPEDTLEHRYWNTVAYADRSFGEFVDRARADGWLPRTLFVVVSDHIQRAESGESDGPGLFHIPGVLVGPGVPRGVHEGIAGHTDVIPTVAHLAGWGARYAAFGRSILDGDAPHRGAQGATPNLCVRVEAGGWVSRGPAARSGAAGSDIDAIERRLLAGNETARSLVLRDHLAPRR